VEKVTYVKRITVVRTVEVKKRWLGENTTQDDTLHEKETFTAALHGKDWVELKVSRPKADGTLSFFARTDDGTESWFGVPPDALSVEYAERSEDGST